MRDHARSLCLLLALASAALLHRANATDFAAPPKDSALKSTWIDYGRLAYAEIVRLETVAVTLAAVRTEIATLARAQAPSLTLRADGSVLLEWEDMSDNEAGFRIERSADGALFVEIGTVASNVTQFRDASLLIGATYWWRVVAYNDAGSSEPSNTASAAPLSP